MPYRERLSRDTRLVVFDQRGALRSEAVGADEPFTLNDLVEELEALRRELHIARWTPIGHSFAGLIVARYALAYPASVDKLVFDDPSFDIGASDRAMLEMLAQGYDRAGMPEPAAEARAAALKPMTPRESWQAFARMGSALGTARRLDLYADVIRRFVHP